MSLEDDIARLAALRGKPAANYTAEAQRMAREARRVHSSEVVSVFRMMADTRSDFRAYDALPRASRLMLRELPVNASAVKYADLLIRMESERSLIDAIRDHLPGVVRHWLLDHYGSSHPGTRRLA